MPIEKIYIEKKLPSWKVRLIELFHRKVVLNKIFLQKSLSEPLSPLGQFVWIIFSFSKIGCTTFSIGKLVCGNFVVRDNTKPPVPIEKLFYPKDFYRKQNFIWRNLSESIFPIDKIVCANFSYRKVCLSQISTFS